MDKAAAQMSHVSIRILICASHAANKTLVQADRQAGRQMRCRLRASECLGGIVSSIAAAEEMVPGLAISLSYTLMRVGVA